ncbi:hypothetical protein JM93_01344 [Roseibium hamelinense]|uniref:Uncharacterized protein n=1 Tax=Roseibium hamelinense TaxID=150831 RepID=A0A562TAG1_9HYPH|nr:hypothetical protein [Roseibium hamelinense]MTI45275.1 hypothetical protein [Roseibium hamelinense]TWI90363.1 hypothetical protein JM93_01344 [Roseibium hamelinense]
MLTDLAVWFAQSQAGTWLQASASAYTGAAAIHVLGLLLLVASVVPVEVKRLELWPSVRFGWTWRLLFPFALTGLMLAVASGVVLFAAQPQGYLGIWIFAGKMTFILVGALAAMALQFAEGFWLQKRGYLRRRFAGGLSVTCWISTLFAGRMMTFSGF